jgi:DNA-binding NarL/FixJ family response regulator
LTSTSQDIDRLARVLQSLAPVRPLSQREAEVAYVVAVEGLNAPDAGRRLSISSKTIESHRRNLAVVLGIRTRDLDRYLLKAYWRAVGRDEAVAA